MNKLKPKKYLMSIFSAPMQAWGSAIAGNMRTIEDHPTKSGVTGYLACCKGISRDEPDKLVALAENIKVAVRVDAPGRLCSDFQTVGRTYLRYSSDPPKKQGSAILTLREYLCGAVFTICTSGDNLEQLYQAVREPVYTPYLGRKCCLPNAICARIVEASNIAEAFSKYNVTEIFKDLSPLISQDDPMVKVYWEGDDDSIPVSRVQWKYDAPAGIKRYRQRKEFMGYIERKGA